jgi:CBS domain-containing membrane protein
MQVDNRARRAAGLFFGSFVAMLVLSLVAMALRTPFVFPSLGPTALLLLYARRAPQSTPWRTLTGHAIGIACGFGSLAAAGLAQAPSAMSEGIGVSRVLAAALSLAGTGAGMVLLDAFHPPAGATTLIISLGIIRKPFHLLIIETAVAVLVGLALLVDWLELKFRIQ